MTQNEFCKVVCPGVSCLTSLVQFPHRQNSSKSLMGHFSQGLLQFIPDTGRDGGFESLQDQTSVSDPHS